MQVVVLPHDANRGGRACGLAYRCIGTGPRERPASPTVIWRLAKGAPKQGHLWKGVTRGYPLCDQQKSRSNERPALNAYAIRDANPVLLHVKHCAGCYPNQGAFVNVIKIGVFS